MKKLLLILVLIAIPVVLAITYKEAIGKEKPQVLFFYTQGCSACNQFKPLFAQMASKYSKKFNFIKQDANNSSLASKFKINSVPAVFIINTETGAASPISYDCLQQQGCFENKLSNY